MFPLRAAVCFIHISLSLRLPRSSRPMKNSQSCKIMSSSGARDRKRQSEEPLSPEWQDRRVVVDYEDSMDGMTDMDEESQTGEEEISAIFTWRGYVDEVFLRYLHEFSLGENVDVTIEHDRGFIDFHREILARGSPYLIGRVEELERAQQPTLVRISAKAWLVKNLADLLYTGEVAVERRYVHRLYHFFRFLEVIIALLTALR
ncbi:unnamed protein product [Trichogramma brassicae]|uniref:BTB domain-containing protein n=1 Tax=Trichogramma brassicae TaxID=86971 RepID=A0A6H5I5D6_9HYME|nr:unnamed protein product [Trichogramma brassicae]